MAATVQDVQDLIESSAADHGYDGVEIQRRLDLGQSAYRIAVGYWEKRAQDTLYMVSVSESGSSRSLDVIHSRMVAMADKYRKLAEQEEEETEEPEGDRFMRTHEIKRV